MTTEETITLYAERVEPVRKKYGIGQELPAEVTIFAQPALDLPVGYRKEPRGRPVASDSDFCRKCGARDWIRRDGHGRKCRECRRAMERARNQKGDA